MKNSYTISDFYSQKPDILWSDRKNNTNQISVLNYVEHNSEEIKKKFCDLVDNLSIFMQDQKKIFNNLNLDYGYNFFWSSDFYEKSFYKSPEIINQIKLIALQEILKNLRVKKLIININSKIDTDSVVQLCKDLEINYENKIKKISINIINFKKILYPLITVIKFIKFIFIRLAFENIDWSKINNSKPKNIFFGYSVYSDKNKLMQGSFNSPYWDPLIENNLVKNSLWVNLYFHTKNNSLNKEIKYYKNINNTDYPIIFIEQLADFKIFINSLKKYFKIFFKLYFFHNSINVYLKKKNCFFLKYHFFNYYEKSFYGLPLIVNIFYYYLFCKLKKNIHSNPKIFYLFENQGWEKTLNFIFFSEFKTIAVNHSSIRYWDLRFIKNKNLNIKYLPKIYAVNSNDSYKKLILNNFEMKKIINLEALRYYELYKKINKNINNKNIKTILIVSDVHNDGNKNLEKLLQNIIPSNFSNNIFLLK